MSWKLIFILVCNGEAVKILGVFPEVHPSHYFLGKTLMKELAERGHEVTMISPFFEDFQPKNGHYKNVILTGIIKENEEIKKIINFFEYNLLQILVNVPALFQLKFKLTDFTLGHKNVQELLKSNQTFDVVIIEQNTNDALKGLAMHFNAPLVVLSPFVANPLVNILMKNPAPPSTIPVPCLPFTTMNFGKRVFNSLTHMTVHLVISFYSHWNQQKIYQKYFPNGASWDTVLHNISTAFVNSHTSTNLPVPYVRNMMEIGGFHIKAPKKLPENLQDFLDNSKYGVIYFSMGSVFQSRSFTKEKRQAFIAAFAQLRQNVIWKWEGEKLEVSDNVKLGKWFPQIDILAHPNVKLFINHGGLLSMMEAIQFGVPVLAIPIAYDHHINAQLAVDQNIGLSIKYKKITSPHSILNLLHKLLNDSSYSTSAKKKSVISRDRILNPMDIAVYWVEYVVRHKGASYLQYSAPPLYKYYLIDVMTLVLLTFTFVTICVYFLSFKIRNRN